MKELNRVQKKLLAQFFVPLILALGLIVLFETETLVPVLVLSKVKRNLFGCLSWK